MMNQKESEIMVGREWTVVSCRTVRQKEDKIMSSQGVRQDSSRTVG